MTPNLDFIRQNLAVSIANGRLVFTLTYVPVIPHVACHRLTQLVARPKPFANSWRRTIKTECLVKMQSS